MDTVESYDPIENTWWLHEESRMNHERCDTGMCVVRFPTCSISQDTLTPILTSRNVMNSTNIHSSPSAVSSASVNFHSAINQSSTWQLNDFNTNRTNNVRINTQISVGHANPSSFQGSPSSSTRNVLSSSVSEPFRTGSQFGCPSASMNACNVNSQSPGNSHLSSTHRRSNRQVRSHSSRQNSLSNTASVNGRELRNSRPPRHLLSLTASSLYPGNINVWNPKSMRLPYVAQGMHNPRNNRSLLPSLLCNPHNILHCNTTPISHLTQQVENPLLNHNETLSHTLDNIPSSSDESYIIQNNESTVNSAFSMMQQTDQLLDNCGNVDINELASNLNASHFDASTVTGSHLPASQRSSCSSPTLVSDIHHSAPEYGSSASCKHDLFRSVDAINRLDSDNVFWSISNISTFSVIENPTASTFPKATTFNEDSSNNVVIGTQADNISGNVNLDNIPSRNYVSLVSDSPDEQDHTNAFGDVSREHGDLVKCTDRSSYKTRTFMNTLINKPRELQSNPCVLSSNDSSELPCEQPCDITLASSYSCNSSVSIPIAKVKPCSSTVVENSCTTTLNALPPPIRNTSSTQQVNDPSICRNKPTFDQLCQRYKPVMPHSFKTDPIWPFRYNTESCQTHGAQEDRIITSANDQKASSSLCEVNDQRVITIGETSFVFGVSESSHAYSESDDLLIRNQSDNPNQTGVSVKPDVTCTTSVVESIHSTGAHGCSSSNSDDALVNQPHSLIDNPSNCEPDITLCTVVCNPGNVDDSPEPQPDTRSDGEGEEGDDLDVVLRNPAVGQVDDDL
ncbi:unnamed protein product [Schistosoma mattheei]|uniref:Uncharacterized protein n=1 Tax=Schistosoma mattheei TaxID=31246 RepID=A0A3P7ZN03_9TREM|nr:unnamed protein product [Schistosoma mattheei]